MKAYGYKRKNKLTCKYGCCTYKKGSTLTEVRRAAKKRARRTSKAVTHEDA